MPLIKYLMFLAGLPFYFTPIFCQQLLKPFPQHTTYTKGTIKPDLVSQTQMDDSVLSFYKLWKERYINDDAGDGQFYVWVEGSVGGNQCVSEAQGYGMMIVVLMAGADSSAHTTYNGLFKYFKSHPSKRSPSLMAWAQKENFKDYETTSATDGDMDIAYSLLLANTQWGSKSKINYLGEARQVIAAIAAQEINQTTFSILLSNAVTNESNDYFDTRSSDFMPSHFKCFSRFSKDALWTKVINNTYRLFEFMQEKYSPDAGLLPDFIEHVGEEPLPARRMYLESKHDGAYSYNACRDPWRIATDYILYGDKRAKSMVQKINNWVKETSGGNPTNIFAGYSLAGDGIRGRDYEAMSFIAPLAVSAMVDPTNQVWLNKLWDYIFSFDIDQFDCYGNTIKMLNTIILSGNYWDPLEKNK
jgi:endoglucanase